MSAIGDLVFQWPPSGSSQGLVARLVKQSTNAVQTGFSVSGSSVTVLSPNANRLGATVVNDAVNDLYVKLGTGCTTGSYTLKVTSASFYELKDHVYTGNVSVCYAIVNSFTGSVRVTELS